MSWTLLLFATPPPENMRDWQPGSMGPSQSVRELIDRGLRDVVWSGDGWGQYGNETCLLEFQVGQEASLECVLVKARGPSATRTLLQVTKAAGWCLVDGSTMEVIEQEQTTEF